MLIPYGGERGDDQDMEGDIPHALDSYTAFRHPVVVCVCVPLGESLAWWCIPCVVVVVEHMNVYLNAASRGCPVHVSRTCVPYTTSTPPTTFDPPPHSHESQRGPSQSFVSSFLSLIR